MADRKRNADDDIEVDNVRLPALFLSGGLLDCLFSTVFSYGNFSDIITSMFLRISCGNFPHAINSINTLFAELPTS